MCVSLSLCLGKRRLLSMSLGQYRLPHRTNYWYSRKPWCKTLKMGVFREHTALMKNMPTFDTVFFLFLYSWKYTSNHIFSDWSKLGSRRKLSGQRLLWQHNAPSWFDRKISENSSKMMNFMELLAIMKQQFKKNDVWKGEIYSSQ